VKKFLTHQDFEEFRKFKRISSDIKVLGCEPAYKDIVEYVEACAKRQSLSFDMEAYLKQNPEPQNQPNSGSFDNNNTNFENNIVITKNTVMTPLELENYLKVVKEIQIIGV
jgi:hypothetical protein